MLGQVVIMCLISSSATFALKGLQMLKFLVAICVHTANLANQRGIAAVAKLKEKANSNKLSRKTAANKNKKKVIKA